MAYYGRLLSNDLLMHAIRTQPDLKDAQGRPLTVVTLRRRANGTLRQNGDYKRHKRRMLFAKQHGLCWYCKTLMVLVERGGDGFPPKGSRIGPNEATLEHLHPKYSPERGKHSGEMAIVLAHSRCNTERSRKDIAAMSIQARWEMSWNNFLDIAKRSGALNEVTE